MIERRLQSSDSFGRAASLAACMLLVTLGCAGFADEVRAADQTSDASEAAGVSLKYDADRDFRQLKGSLSPPVPEPAAHDFGRRKQDDSKSYIRHTGLTYEIDAGTRVRAASDGLVVFADRFEGFGHVVIVDHGDDFHTLYAHLRTIDVEPGEEIEQEARLGLSGASESLEGPKLYFELREDGKPIDPEPWFFRDEREENEKDE